MVNQIGRFEILGEITHSEIGSVYKASDPQSGQTVALKTVQLQMLGDHAADLVQNVQQEVESAKALNSHNIAVLYQAEEIDGQLCAAMEYVQGNSIATMLARKEGFSIWDLLDIARQTCQGLDHAHGHQVAHYSLEPAKIMVTWDGTVKILDFGISTIGAYASQASGKASEALYYMSPEQLRGEPLDARSNLFSLGAVLYEMVTERKAFEAADGDHVRQQILEQMPAAPGSVNSKVHPALSEVIMKALAKAPEERYQSGQELVNDLERCKASATKTAAKATKVAQPARGLNVPQAQKIVSTAPPAKPVLPVPPAEGAAARVEVRDFPKPAAPENEQAPSSEEFAVAPEEAASLNTPPAAAKASAAAAGWESAVSSSASGPTTPKLDPIAQSLSPSVRASVQAAAQEEATLSAAAAEPEVETPRFAVDPMMDEGNQAANQQGRGFSDIDELPPLKEVYVAPAPPPPAPEPEPAPPVRASALQTKAPEKPKMQPRQVAKKAVTEIKKTPPKLFLYSIAGAVGFILLVVVWLAFRIHSENADESGASTPPAATASAQPQEEVAASQQAAAPETPGAAPATTQPAPEEIATEPSAVSVTPKYKKKARAPAPAAAPIPGQLTVNSTPEGAEIQVDGRNDANWLTPFNLTGLNPGPHRVTVSKAGYAPDTRTIEVASASKSFLVVQLAQLGAAVSITSEPAGAAILMDGKDTGRVTPAQISVEKPGSHTFLVRKQGYLEESTTANLQAGQVFPFAPVLRALGNTNEIRTAGRFKKMFGGGDTAGTGAVSVKTQPKGAQVAVNNRIVDKPSPVEFYLNPGTYVLDITMSGFKSIHRVITVERGGKTALDETMQRE